MPRKLCLSAGKYSYELHSGQSQAVQCQLHRRGPMIRGRAARRRRDRTSALHQTQRDYIAGSVSFWSAATCRSFLILHKDTFRCDGYLTKDEKRRQAAALQVTSALRIPCSLQAVQGRRCRHLSRMRKSPDKPCARWWHLPATPRRAPVLNQRADKGPTAALRRGDRESSETRWPLRRFC